MGDSRVVIGETLRLPISNGDWVLVKKRLNAGENKRMRRRGTAPDGSVDLINAGLSILLAYLVDWSLTGPDGTVIPIRHQPESAIEAALDSIDPDSYGELLRAIEAHMDAQTAAAEKKKNGRWRDDIRTYFSIALRCGWTIDQVRNLDVDEYDVLLELLNEDTAASQKDEF